MDEALKIAVRFEAYGQMDDFEMHQDTRSKLRHIRSSATSSMGNAGSVTAEQFDILLSRLDKLTQMVIGNQVTIGPAATLTQKHPAGQETIAANQ